MGEERLDTTRETVLNSFADPVPPDVLGIATVHPTVVNI
jgi:hypothetical protein